MTGLIRHAAAERQRAEYWKKRDEEQRAQELRRLEEEQRQQRERERLQALIAEAERWKAADLIRAYLQAIRAKCHRDSKVLGPNTRLGRWVRWAEDRAETLDPIAARLSTNDQDSPD